MSKHTPEPWSLELDPDGGFIITNGPAAVDGTWVLAARGPIAHRAEQSHSNGHMMAAAPDLLEALRECRELFSAIRSNWEDPRTECRAGIASIDAAIAKAEGK